MQRTAVFCCGQEHVYIDFNVLFVGIGCAVVRRCLFGGAMIAFSNFSRGTTKMRRIIMFFATVCYVGRLPLAPGTWGTVVAVGFYWLIRYLSPLSYAITVVAFIFFAVWISGLAQRLMFESDPREVVIDEMAGYLVAMAFHQPKLALAIAGFILFRIFDIAKPPPIRWVERRFTGGLGVVLDDVVAGIYANLTLWFIVLALPALGIKWV